MTGWLLFSMSKQILTTKQLLAMEHENKIKKYSWMQKKNCYLVPSERFITTSFMWHAQTPFSFNPQWQKNSKSIIYHVLFIIVGCKCFAHFSSSSSPRHNKYHAHNYRVPKIRNLCCCFNTTRINNKLSNFMSNDDVGAWCNVQSSPWTWTL